MTLIELLVAGIISLIAASGMVIVMANTLGTGSQTIQMSRLSQEMRTAMQIMSRELRRANYHGGFLSCYGNTACLGAGFLNISSKIAPINITDNGNSDCFWFWYQRPGATMANTQTAAFRRTLTGTVGKLQMAASSTMTSAPNCNLDASYWVDITDPTIIDVQEFNVVDEGFIETINAAGATLSVERVGLTIRAKLVTDPLTITGLTAPPNVVRELQEFVTVRNNTTAP